MQTNFGSSGRSGRKVAPNRYQLEQGRYKINWIHNSYVTPSRLSLSRTNVTATDLARVN